MCWLGAMMMREKEKWEQEENAANTPDERMNGLNAAHTKQTGVWEARKIAQKWGRWCKGIGGVFYVHCMAGELGDKSRPGADSVGIGFVFAQGGGASQSWVSSTLIP